MGYSQVSIRFKSSVEIKKLFFRFYCFNPSRIFNSHDKINSKVYLYTYIKLLCKRRERWCIQSVLDPPYINSTLSEFV